MIHGHGFIIFMQGHRVCSMFELYLEWVPWEELLGSGLNSEFSSVDTGL